MPFEPIPFSQGAAELPCRRQGRKTHPSTLHRWVAKGVKGIRLRSIMIGGMRFTTRAWLAEFFDQLTEARSAATTSPPSVGMRTGIRTAAQRERAAKAADAELQRLGI